ncbi:MAG: heat-inducible transcriptional repressor HrcA [Elusimicrobiota bacterium]
MRILKPEVAKERKDKILNWLIYNYISNGKPVSSKEIFESKIFNISPASIRNILKELDEEGYLEQVHTSGGRIPTDKAYRAYVDNLLNLQNLAEMEKERVELDYERRIAELDYFLKHTTKILSDLTKKIGFSMVTDISNESIKRIDIVKVSSFNYIFIIVTQSGIIKHYPFTFKDSKINVKNIVSVLNKRLKNNSIIEAKEMILKEFIAKDSSGIYKIIYDIFVSAAREDDELFLEGLSSIYDDMEDFSPEEIRSMARLLEEKERFSQIIKERFKESLNKAKLIESEAKTLKKHIINVSVGSENKIKELNNFSLITSSYCAGEKNLGLIGIIGHKRMEYPKVISIVDSVSSMIESILSEWEEESEDL